MEEKKKHHYPRVVTPKQARLLKTVATADSLGEALLQAGYAKVTSLKAPGHTVAGAFNALEQAHPVQQNQLLNKVGVTREQLFERYRYIAMEAKSLDVSLRALAPMLASEDIHLQGDGNNTIVPIQIVVDETKQLESHEGGNEISV
jgi:hypothetical protein